MKNKSFTKAWIILALPAAAAAFKYFHLTEPAKIDSLSGILAPGLICSFALLGVFPITTKKILAWYKSRQSSQGEWR